MSTHNVNSAVSSRVLAGESSPITVAPKTKGTSSAEEQAAVKSAPSPEHLKHMVESANKAMDKQNSSLEFKVDNATNKTIIKVTEAGSGKLIMQFPSEEMLSVTRAIDHAQQGALLKAKA